MSGKRSNGEGSISYDKRRKRYRAKITVGWEYDEETNKTKQIVKTLGSNYKTKGEASRALAEYLKNPFDLSNKDVTFSQLYEKWFESVILKENESTKYRMKAAYKYCSAIYNKKFRDITIIDMKDCIYNGTAMCVRGKYKGTEQFATPQTKESIKILFNRLFAYACEARIVDRNFAKDFSLDKKVTIEKELNKKEKVPFTKEEVQKLWRSIEFIPFADMIVFACYSGWRPGELVKLRTEDVDLETGFIKGGIKTASGRKRLVPIHPLVRGIVQKYYDEAVQIGSEFLFNDTKVTNYKKGKGTGLSEDQYLTRFNKVIEMLKFDINLTPHCTRHTFITTAKSREVSMNENILKLIVGHRIRDLTERVYTHRTMEDLKEEMLKIKE